jgi:diacylglycerol kinase (ATP)
MKKLIANIRNSIKGIKACWLEHSFRLECYVLCLTVPILIILDRPFWLKALSVASILLVMVAEAFNTAIERLCDRITLHDDPQIGLIKDIASSAVFLSVIAAACVWLMLFLTL